MKAVKIITGLLLTLTMSTSCQGQKKENTKITMKNNKGKMVYVTALIYLHEGMQDTFMEYKQKTGSIAQKYGVVIERIIQPMKLAKGAMEIPDEIHIASFPSPEAMQQMNADPAYQKLVATHRNKAIKKMVYMSCKLSDFDFKREVGTQDKTFGLALLNYNEGMKSQFDAYHDEACQILPEFGAHFERFFTVEDCKGDFIKPDEIHLFYFDTPQGMQQMGQDPRMQKLFPKRDQSLKRLNFIIGKAI